jgi:cobalamin biosynthesis protein CobW
VPGCDEASLIELANGCICCTVADDFVPAMEALLGRDPTPEHIVIETSGLALPKPLLKAFDWPAVRSRLTVDGVIAVLDAPAVAEGRFADDPAAVARQRAADAALDHDNPLAEVFEDQIAAADLVLLNKTDLLDDAALARVRAAVRVLLPRAVRMVATIEGRIDPAVLLGLAAAAEDDLASRPSHHDALNGAHEHDDFESFVVAIAEQDTAAPLIERLREAAATHGILRVKGFAALRGRPMRLVVQGVGARFQQHFDRPWSPGEARLGHLVVIGERGLDRTAITAAIGG